MAKKIRSKLMPEHKVFELSDGRKFGAHKRSCLFCEHCSDIFWDYTNGIYGISCDINWNNAESRREHIHLSFDGKCKSFEESEDVNDGEEKDPTS
jgi:hypothetical protein